MDREQGSHVPIAPRGSIPRLSRLPMPRAVASTDNLRLNVRTSAAPRIHQDDLRKNSHLPLPATSAAPLGETVNRSIRSRYGWSDNSSLQRSTSPVRDALRDVRSTTLETTPPASNCHLPVFEDGNENIAVGENGDGAHEHKEKRRPRPSLSERTIETLSQFSPGPSSHTKTTTLDSDSRTFSPLRPASSMREIRPKTPAAYRPESPTRRPFRPPGRLSPTKDKVALPPVVSPRDIYTPPKAFDSGRHSRIAKPREPPRRPASSALGAHPQDAAADVLVRMSAQTVRSKPSHYSSKTLPSQTATVRPSLASIFRDPLSNKAAGSGSAPSTTDTTRPTNTRPRMKGDNAAPTTPVARAKVKKSATATEQDQSVGAVQGSRTTNSPNSSAALREAVAKAKAARRKAATDSGSVHVQSAGTSTSGAAFGDVELETGRDNSGSLQKRIQQAGSSGQLNVAALSLKRIPTEVLKMYDADYSNINWSEMVDLVKLNAANNEIDEIEDQFFPDYTVAELADDDEKSNMFGGLEVIDLHRNTLHRLPVGLRRLERLQTLDLGNNQLSIDAIEIAGQIPKLKRLMMGENLLAGSLNLKDGQFEHLEVLDLHGNRLDQLHAETLSQLRSLQVLNLAGNMLTTLPWDSLSSLPLKELNISKNRLSGVLFQGTLSLQKLRTLDSSFNDLELVSASELDLPALSSLILDGNRITELPDLTGCKQLQVLRVAENQLKDIPPTFVRLETLKSADFGNNNIRLIDPDVAAMKNLSTFSVVGNPLREKKYLTMTTTELKMDLEKKMAAAQTEAESSGASGSIDGTTNHGYRFKPSGGILDLSSRSLRAISPEEIDVSDLDSPIHTVKLSNNEFSEIPTTLLSHPSLKYSVRSLDLSHNPLLHPTDYLGCELFLPNLKSLYIVSTGLTSLDALTTYLKAPSLTELNISCHRLNGRVPWVRAWWPKCHTLLATDNWFTSVEAEGVRGLEVLDVRNNEIEALPPKIGLLGNLPGTTKAPGKLRVLEVSGNKFRVPRVAVIEKGTEAVLKDLRRMIPEEEVPEDWKHAF